jgi:hypothetical protein
MCRVLLRMSTSSRDILQSTLLKLALSLSRSLSSSPFVCVCVCVYIYSNTFSKVLYEVSFIW